MLKVHGRIYRRLLDNLRGSYGDTARNNARMNILDHDPQQRTPVSHLGRETVKCIADKLKEHNSWVNEYRGLFLLKRTSQIATNMSVSFEETSRVDPTVRT